MGAASARLNQSALRKNPEGVMGWSNGVRKLLVERSGATSAATPSWVARVFVQEEGSHIRYY